MFIFIIIIIVKFGGNTFSDRRTDGRRMKFRARVYISSDAYAMPIGLRTVTVSNDNFTHMHSFMRS